MFTELAKTAKPKATSEVPKRGLEQRIKQEAPAALPSGLQYDFARIPVTAPDHPMEREADHVADQITRKTEPQMDAAPTVQTAGRRGAPLSEEVRSYFEPRFGHDFSQVRVHADNAAADRARSIQARAYTLGSDIVFGAGQFAPDTAPGRHLVAHELTHVVQQNGANSSPRMVMRKREEPAPSALDQLPDDTKQNLKVDTDESHSNIGDFFNLAGAPNLAKNVDPDFDFKTPQIDALTDQKAKQALIRGLRLYALSTFDLLPEGSSGLAHSKRLNLVHIENLDLTRWGGPNTSFRFSCAGEQTKKQIKVKILVEALDLPAKPMADRTATAGIEKSKAAPYGLGRDSSVTEDQWEKVLRSLGKIQEALLMRLRDITFETSDQQVSPKGESAMFVSTFRAGHWTKKIVLFQKMNSATDPDFAYTIAHEIGHALDDAPFEGAAGPVVNAEAHNDPKFQEAAKKDGGRAKAITKYAKTDDFEFFAECFALFIQQRDTLRSLRPNIYRFFQDYQWGGLKDPKLNPYYAPAQPGPRLSSRNAPLF